ncbi:hypothetical protein SAMN05660209_00080 [Geodermatophilus africanus]|uniref:DoxX protein n=1 Tax=Geodermatophilus africanus TaxID=1137993 RepID=A0A1H3AKK5_9ACTN|nr:hypothetical protein [Geodermatophilus africanus]SDX29981.1 hypothetical protein SAMN05660209_00080 [Geodermatophilus africanus]
MEPLSPRGLPPIGRKLEAATLRLAAQHSTLLLRTSLGIVFLWFALPKFVPGLSPADQLAQDTIAVLTGGLVTGDTARVLLAVLETAIALGLLTGRFLRLTLLALFAQMAGTLTPLVLFWHDMWTAPLVPGIEGQYIIKNLVLIAAAITITGSLPHAGRRGRSQEAPAATATAGVRADTPVA